jgi:hypothetical protein
MAAASSNFIVSAKAAGDAVIARTKNIDRIGFMASFHMKQVPLVKLSSSMRPPQTGFIASQTGIAID